MATAKFVNFNQGLSLGGEDAGIFSRIRSAGGNFSSSTTMIIAMVLLFVILAGLYYYYYVYPKTNAKYHPNNELNSGSQQGNGTAELLFFFATWCPHCKTAKPIWEELQKEYANKTINGYKVIFTEIDCTEETAEVEKMMNKYNVEGYPTIKLLKDGQVIEYDAKPTKETLTQFLNTVL